MKAAYAANDRTRGEGGRNLLEAARRRRSPATSPQSVAFFCRPTGAPGLRDEDTPLWTDAPGMIGEAAQVVERDGDGGARRRRRRAALRLLRRAGHVVRRATARSGALVRKRRYPLVGEGAGVHSFIHVDDAAAATVAALGRAVRHLQRRRRPPGADARVAPRRSPPRSAPRRRGTSPPAPLKLLGGQPLVTWQDGLEGQSNARAKSDLDWTPVHGDLADRVPRPVRFLHGARRATEAGQRMPAVLDVLRPRDQARRPASPPTAPRSTTTTTR